MAQYELRLNKRDMSIQLKKISYSILLEQTGRRGPQGQDGADGPPGPTGDPGPQGVPGQDGVVQSIVAGTNVTVDPSDPANPIVSASAGIESVVAGAGINVDSTDTANPIVINAKDADFIGTWSAGSNNINFYDGSPSVMLDAYTPKTGDILEVRTAGSKDFGQGVVVVKVGDLIYFSRRTGFWTKMVVDTDISNLVPYTGATSDLDLGLNDISAGNLSGTNTGDQDLSGYQQISGKGVANGYAELDGAGLVPSSQLPSYVDDVIMVADFASLPVTGAAGKIYVTEDTNITYRWTGSGYAEISASLALGETSATAYRGDRGKVAYDHSQDVTTNPHNVTKTQVGLGNVDNTSDATKNSASVTLTNKTISGANNTLSNIPESAVTSLTSDLAGKQPLDTDLTTIAGLTATTDNFIVAVSSAWASRTPAQAKTTLALNNVDNTSNATERAASAALTNKDISSSTNTYRNASTTVIGASELATIAETDTGTDTTRTVTPDGLAGSYAGTKAVSVYAIEAGTTLTTGDGKAYFSIPTALNGMGLVSVGVSVIAKSTSGLPNVMISRGRQANATTAHAFVDMLSTALTIDANEFDSKDATTPAVINTSNDDVLMGDLIRVDVDNAGTGTTGLIVRLGFRLP